MTSGLLEVPVPLNITALKTECPSYNPLEGTLKQCLSCIAHAWSVHHSNSVRAAARSIFLEADLGFLYYPVMFGFSHRMEMLPRATGSHASTQQDWPGAGYAAKTQEEHMAEGKKSPQNRCSYWQLQSTPIHRAALARRPFWSF